MDELAQLSDTVLFRLKPLIDRQVDMKYQQLEAMYRDKVRCGTELSLKLSEIVTLKEFLSKLESDSRKVTSQLKKEVENATR